MHCGRVCVKGEAEENAISPRPRSRQKHGKRSNPYSACGLDKFQSVYAELSSKREYVANKTGVPEAMVRFVSSKNGWIPVVMGARDQKIHGGDAARVSTLVPAEDTNGETGGELRIKDERNDIIDGSERKGAPTSAVRAHGDLTDFCATVSVQAVNPKNNDPEHNHRHHHSEVKTLRRAVSLDSWASPRPASPVLRSENFYRNTRAAEFYDASVGALTIMIITMFCFVFYGRLFAILFTSAWLYLVAMFR